MPTTPTSHLEPLHSLGKHRGASLGGVHTRVPSPGTLGWRVESPPGVSSAALNGQRPFENENRGLHLHCMWGRPLDERVPGQRMVRSENGTGQAGGPGRSKFRVEGTAS